VNENGMVIGRGTDGIALNGLTEGKSSELGGLISLPVLDISNDTICTANVM
jgi:hypothetical protein